jgi:hypothetical protein
MSRVVAVYITHSPIRTRWLKHFKVDWKCSKELAPIGASDKAVFHSPALGHAASERVRHGLDAVKEPGRMAAAK